ncbi:MAG TPA: DUF2279 domain-containing protein, partial [Burkholderiales bacterium]|nr:DUF2279 domain-containing protein [Burkholderiales bacterium]
MAELSYSDGHLREPCVVQSCLATCFSCHPLSHVVANVNTPDLIPSGATPANDSARISIAGETNLSPEQVRFRTWGLIGGGALAVYAYGRSKWWEDGFTNRFRTVDEGWFGQNTNDGGADKLGHVFANYVGARLMTRAFEWAGNDEATALKL